MELARWFVASLQRSRGTGVGTRTGANCDTS